MYDADISLLLMLTNVAVVILPHVLLQEHRYCNIHGALLTSCLYTAVITTAMEDIWNIHKHTAIKLKDCTVNIHNSRKLKSHKNMPQDRKN